MKHISKLLNIISKFVKSNSSHCQWNAEVCMIVRVHILEEELCFLYDESAVLD